MGMLERCYPHTLEGGHIGFHYCFILLDEFRIFLMKYVVTEKKVGLFQSNVRRNMQILVAVSKIGSSLHYHYQYWFL